MNDINQTDDVLVAGAGIWGCTIARRLAEAGHRVAVWEKRGAPGGNVRCETDSETGIEVHAYGSHIFHTHDREAWNFVRRFTEFNGYQHKVLARHGGKTYHLPLGLAMINKFFGVELEPGEVAAFMSDEKHSSAIFDAFFRGYTSKQWGRPPEDIDPAIIKRVPVRSNYDTNYFNDYWQGIPSDGYNALFGRLLDHPYITLETGREFSIDDIGSFPGKVYYSGPIDALFGYRFGALPWRSLRFETERLDIADFQGTSVVNYTEAEVPYTRIHEFKHYHPELKDVMARPKTIICREYPAEWKPGDEPYYPVNNRESAELLEKYREEAAKHPNLIIGGRLGQYRYYDMDQAVSAALKVEI
ncbi:MAG: FAD-dependent oxidoreductase [Kiritimatiellae bacterium]|nr:FAD-dependent oxidoreductase [Kiritimatiellia bacterium]